MSMDWFRSWHGAPTDTKWLSVAKRAGVPAGMVSAVAWAMFDCASRAEDRGSVEAFDAEDYASFSGFEQAQVDAIIKAMNDKEIIKNNRLAAWDRRQPKREDTGAAERKQKQRDKEQDENVTQCHAVSRSVTLDKTREDEEKKVSTPPKPPKGRARAEHPDFETWYQLYPHKVGRAAALSAFTKAVRKADLTTLMAGLGRYLVEKPPDRSWCNPATWLNQERWNDKPQEINHENTGRNHTDRLKTAGDSAVAELLADFDARHGRAEVLAIAGPD